jgi:hypothetical protein
MKKHGEVERKELFRGGNAYNSLQLGVKITLEGFTSWII